MKHVNIGMDDDVFNVLKEQKDKTPWLKALKIGCAYIAKRREEERALAAARKMAAPEGTPEKPPPPIEEELG